MVSEGECEWSLYTALEGPLWGDSTVTTGLIRHKAGALLQQAYKIDDWVGAEGAQ